MPTTNDFDRVATDGGIRALLGLAGEIVQLAVRFGHGGLAPYSLRRQLDEGHRHLNLRPQLGAVEAA